MLDAIKTQVEREVRAYAAELRRPPLSRLPAVYSRAIGDFVRRKGKRIRSVLFVVAYRGYSRRNPKNLYRSAAALELLHDFILIHDDLIDHAATRRGRASMHASFEAKLRGAGVRRFRGEDLALIVGDMLYAMALHGFLAIEENPARKHRAFTQLTRTAVFTGCGELDELLQTLKPLSRLKEQDIYRIYDWKTGYYTFLAPLTMGAILGGAREDDLRLLHHAGQLLGRAFQIRDDLLDLNSNGSSHGKPPRIDLREGKKTIPVLYAYRHSSPARRRRLEAILATPNPPAQAIEEAAGIILESGALDRAADEIRRMVKDACALLDSTRMQRTYCNFVTAYARSLLLG